jgi:hypothetical protein
MEAFEKDSFGNIYFYIPGTDILHNLNGPAIIHSYGKLEYWVNGVLFNEEQYNAIKEYLKLSFDLQAEVDKFYDEDKATLASFECGW